MSFLVENTAGKHRAPFQLEYGIPLPSQAVGWIFYYRASASVSTSCFLFLVHLHSADVPRQ